MNDRDPDLGPWLNDDEGEGEGESPNPIKLTGSQFVERRLLEARTLLVSGPVTDKLASYCTTRLMLMEKMDPERPITVVINSPGGSADSGFAIYDMMRYVQPPVRTLVNGMCASAAVLVLLAAKKEQRFTLPNSRFLIHQPSTAGRGTASDLDITAREILKMRERYNRVISEATGRDMAKVLEDARRDFWLSASEAQEYGLVARVVARQNEID